MDRNGDPDRRVILHLDLDAFFAQAEVLAAPLLRGKPVVVGGIPGQRGAVATASYEARAYGVRSGMALAEAARLCPDAIFLPCNTSRYMDLSVRTLRLLLRRSPLVEVASIDEAFLDATAQVRSLEEGGDLARGILREMAETLSLSCSAGVGPSKLVAKMASGLRKPAGTTVLSRPEFRSRFAPEPAGVLYGVGPATAAKLRAIGVETIGQLARAPDALLRSLLGTWGPVLGAAARGEDESPVVPHHATPAPKSLGHEYTLPRDERDRLKLRRLVLAIADEVAGDMRSEGWMGDTIHLKVRWSDRTTWFRQTRLPDPIASTKRLFRAAWGLFEGCRAPLPVRLVGISVSGLCRLPPEALGADLFGPDRGEDLERAADQLRKVRGRGVIRRASLLDERSP